MLPSVSVVIPLYNHEKYIGSTLYSVLGQHHPSREIIVVDDGSTDAGLSVVQTLARTRPEIVCWGQKNRGAHNTINTAIQRSTSDLVAILNSDDLYHPERFLRAAEAFAADPTLDVFVSGMNFVNGDGVEVPFDWYDQAIEYHQECDDLGKTLINGNIFVTTSNLIVRRSLFDRVGLFSDLRYAHDLDFFLRLVSEDCRILIAPDKLMSYRIHETNTISEGHMKVKLEWAAVSAFHLATLSRRPDGWRRVADYMDVLAKHALMEPVMLLLGYFLAKPSFTLDRHPYHTDEAFKALVREQLG